MSVGLAECGSSKYGGGGGGQWLVPFRSGCAFYSQSFFELLPEQNIWLWVQGRGKQLRLLNKSLFFI